MSAIVRRLPLDSTAVDAQCVVLIAFGEGIGVMNKMIWVWLVMAGCGSGSESMEEVVAVSTAPGTTVYSDGVPDAGSTWTQDPATGWGQLVGGVNFTVPYQAGSTTRGSYITDNANSCMYCADGDSVVMMYVAYVIGGGPYAFEVLGQTSSAGDGIQRLYTVQLTRAPSSDEQLVVRFVTDFVMRPTNPRTTLIQPPILL